jgi:predicted DCC family thiol-disulfide oxidoreductase YuxK
MILLYDGDCRFCTRSARAVQGRLGTDRVAVRNFQEPGVLAGYSNISHEAAMKKMHLVMPDGRVFAGAEAFARMAAGSLWVGRLALLYYVPGIRQLADLGYSLVAKYRYRLATGGNECADGTCRLHG